MKTVNYNMRDSQFEYFSFKYIYDPYWKFTIFRDKFREMIFFSKNTNIIIIIMKNYVYGQTFCLSTNRNKTFPKKNNNNKSVRSKSLQ